MKKIYTYMKQIEWTHCIRSSQFNALLKKVEVKIHSQKNEQKAKHLQKQLDAIRQRFEFAVNKKSFLESFRAYEDIQKLNQLLSNSELSHFM